jgi:hypothetical protein
VVLVQLQNNDHSPSHFVALELEVPQTKTPQKKFNIELAMLKNFINLNNNNT